MYYENEQLKNDILNLELSENKYKEQCKEYEKMINNLKNELSKNEIKYQDLVELNQNLNRNLKDLEKKANGFKSQFERLKKKYDEDINKCNSDNNKYM